MKYPIILLDADDTLLDFAKSEREAFARVMPLFGAPGDRAALEQYNRINDKYWHMLEQGRIGKQRLLVQRFEDFFALHGLQADCVKANEQYLETLATIGHALPGAQELCNLLKTRGHKLYIVTNGTERAQRGRLDLTSMTGFFDDIFISDKIGHQKPDVRFFEYVFEKLNYPDKSRCIIFGDSLTSDMRGGKNAGIATCWYNPRRQEPSADCDFTAHCYEQFAELTR